MELKKTFTVLFILGSTLAGQSQTQPLEIGLKDHHTSSLTQVTLHPSGDYLITGDESGKVLMYSAADLGFHKKIAPATGIPVDQLLISEEGILLVNKRQDYYPNGIVADSVLRFDLESLEKQMVIDRPARLLGITPDDATLLAVQDPEDTYSDQLYYIHASDGSKSFSLNPRKKIKSAAFSEGDHLALIGNSLGRDFLEVYRRNGELLYSEEMPLNFQLKQLHYSPEKKGFFLLAFNRENSQLQLQFLTASFEKQVMDTRSFPYAVDVVVTPSDKKFSAFVVTSRHPASTAISYILKKGTYQAAELNLEEPSSLGIYLPGKKQYVFWKAFDRYYDTMVNSRVYSENPFKAVAVFPNTKEGKYRGIFLPGDHWMAIGVDYDLNREAGFATHLKYYDAGTFSNRFGKLDFEDYLKQTHGVDKQKATRFHLDKTSGTVAFSAMQQRDQQFLDLYFSYNLLTDEVREVGKSIEGYYDVAGFNAAQERFLVSTGPFYDRGYEEPRPLKILTGKEVIDLDGLYKHALFSNDGNYLLTVDSENTVSVFDIRQRKVVFSQVFLDGSFQLFADDSDLFILSWSASLIGNDCGKKTITIAPDESGNFEAVPQDCLFITDYDHKGEILAVLVENSLVVVNGLSIMTYGDEAVSLSLNSDGSRLMLSFTSGRTEIYDTADVQRLGSMYHPDRNSHLFVDRENHYFSNMDPSDYLYAQRSGSPVPLDKALENYDPVALLGLFGTPDPAYVAALEKAGDIRKEAVKPSGVGADGPQILQVWLDGNSSLAATEKASVRVKVETGREAHPGEDLLIRINGVKLQKPKIRKENRGILSFELALVDQENTIEITAIDSKGMLSKPVERKLQYTGTPLESDLYVLAIGVSDYEQSAWDLTFADKDAMDIARFYGGFNAEQQKFYEDKFLGQRYRLQDQEGEKLSEISRYMGSYSYLTFLKPLSPNGNLWLGEESDRQYQLWNFETGTITGMQLPEGFDIGISATTRIYPKPEGDGFYFRAEDLYYRYDFGTGNYSELQLPFEKKLQGSQEMITHPLEAEKWMAFETENIWDSQEGDRVSIRIVEPTGKTWRTREISFHIPEMSYAELQGVSPKGDRFLLKLSGSDSLLLATVEGEEVRKERIPVSAGSLKWYEFSRDGNSFSELRSEFLEDSSNRNTYLQYDLQGSLLDSIVLSDDRQRGISNYGDRLKWVGQEPPMIDNYQYVYGSEDRIMAASPASFANTYVEYLVDQEATGEAVKERLDSFLAKARPQDQIIVFLAGHGVLDEKNSYYYAPHDMDFEQVAQNGVSFEGILAGMTASAATRKLLLMDTCHSGNTFDLASGEERLQGERKEGQRGSVATKTGASNVKVSEIISSLFDNFRSTNGITILSASSGEDVAYETKDLGNGAFTTALLNRLRHSLGGDLGLVDEARLAMPVTLTEDLIDKIQTEVMSLTNQKQVPDIREINKLSKIRIW